MRLPQARAWRRRLGRGAAVAVFAYGLGGAVWADTCVNGVRQTTAGERAFHLDTLTRLRAAMPPLPPGWRVVDETEIRAPLLACIGQERRPLTLEYVLRLMPAGPEPAGGADGRAESGTGAPAPAAVRITVRVNAADHALGDAPEPFAVPAVTLAFRGGWTEENRARVHLLVGDWWWDPDDPSEPAGRPRAHASLGADAPHTRVQSLAVELDGARPDVDLMLARLDLPRLAAIVAPGR